MNRKKIEKYIQQCMQTKEMPQENVLARARSAMRNSPKECYSPKIAWEVALCSLVAVFLTLVIVLSFVFLPKDSEEKTGETYIPIASLSFSDDPYCKSVNDFSTQNNLSLVSFLNAYVILTVPQVKPTEAPGSTHFDSSLGPDRIISSYQSDGFDIIKNNDVSIGMREKFIYILNGESTFDKVENIIVFPWSKEKYEFMCPFENLDRTMTIGEIVVRYDFKKNEGKGYAQFILDGYSYYTTVQTDDEVEFIAHMERLLYAPR